MSNQQQEAQAIHNKINAKRMAKIQEEKAKLLQQSFMTLRQLKYAWVTKKFTDNPATLVRIRIAMRNLEAELSKEAA